MKLLFVLLFAVGILSQVSAQRLDMARMLGLMSRDQVISSIKAELSDCARPQIKSGFIERKDVNGDGVPDYVVNYGAVTCGNPPMQEWCGSGGCAYRVYASLDGQFRKVFDDVAGRVRFTKISGRYAMLVDWSGVVCGRANADSCHETRYWNGTEFNAAN